MTMVLHLTSNQYMDEDNRQIMYLSFGNIIYLFTFLYVVLFRRKYTFKDEKCKNCPSYVVLLSVHL